MKIKEIKQIDTAYFGYKPHDHAYSILVEVEVANAKDEAAALLEIIANTSWINALDEIDKESFHACAEPTISKIINSILKKVDNAIEKDFGEYLVSCNAQRALEVKPLCHRAIPLAELFKEKMSGNPGFDFHTVSPNSFVVFGEAKYSSTHTPYDEAEFQINEFLEMTEENKKHIKELAVLRKFTGDEPSTNVLNNSFGVAAAFSIRAKNAILVMKNAIKHENFEKLLDNKEVYLIGVHIV